MRGKPAATAKRCPRCAQHLPLDSFGKNVAKPDGLQLHCRSCRAVQQREYRERHPQKARDLSRAAMRRRREVDPDAERAYMNRWRTENADLVRETKRAWEELNYDRVRVYSRAAHKRWKQRNPEKVKGQDLLRRARKAAATVGDVDLVRLRADTDGSCGLCGEVMDWSLEWPDPMSPSIDHKIPLALGGAHSQANLQWAHLVCNMRKNARLVESA